MSKNKKSNMPDNSGEIPQSLPAAPVPAAAEGTAIAQPKPSLALLFAVKQSEGRKITRYSLPPIIKPSAVGPGIAVGGKIKSVIPSPLAAYKSELLVLSHPAGEFCFPLTAVIRKACLLRVGSEKSELTAADKKTLIGQEIAIGGLGQTKTADGQRSVNLFEVGFVEPEA